MIYEIMKRHKSEKVSVGERQEPSKPTKPQAHPSKTLKHKKSLLFFFVQIQQLI